MKQPRYRLTIEVTIDEYLGLLWAIDGTHPNQKADKQTIRKIAAFQETFWKNYRAWKAKHFKCAGKVA